jgi:hypothetical protein
MPPQLGVDRCRIAQKLAGARNSIAQSGLRPVFPEPPPDCLAKYGERGRQFCTERRPIPSGFLCGAEVENGDGALNLSRDVFLAAILNGQRQAALSVVEEALRAGHSHLDIDVDVVADALQQIGANLVADAQVRDQSAQLIRSVRDHRKERIPRIVVGGAAFRYSPNLSMRSGLRLLRWTRGPLSHCCVGKICCVGSIWLVTSAAWANAFV